MKALIVYDSQYSNTQKVAEAIAKVFGSDGMIVKVDDFRPAMLRGVDVLIVGSPTHAWNYTPSIGSFLATLQSENVSGMYAAAFDTSYSSIFAGSAARRINKALKRMGNVMLTRPKRFFVIGTEGPLAKGELNKATRWAEKIRSAYAGVPKAA